MNKLRATPGPWSVRKHGYPIITDDAKNKWIATIHSVEPENEVREANAHLIAAAPELYEALEELCRYANDSNDCQYGTLSTRLVKDIAEAALAKARGEIND